MKLLWKLVWMGIVGSQAQAAISTYAEFETLMKTRPESVPSIEALLPQLSPELRSNFTFVYESRSPHGGLGDPKASHVSYEFPRAVLFTKDAKWVIAFTGNPQRPGYDTLESIHYNDARAAFEFSKFILPEAVKRQPQLAAEAALNGAVNPAECLRCHGADPRPITDSYPLWPHFYGSVRDTFPKGSPELPFYRKFLKAQKNAATGVYRHLQWPKGTSVPPYLDPKKYNPNKIEGTLTDFQYLPNTRLGMALTELNRKRIQRKLMASPEYGRLKYALLSAFLGCTTLPITEDDLTRIYNELLVENTDRLQRLGYHPKGPGAGDLNMMEIGFYGNVVQLVYMAEALKVDRRDWSMAFEDHSLSFFDGILSSIYDGKDFYLKEDVLLEMLREVSSSEPEFKPFFKTYVAYLEAGYPFGERLDLGAALNACSVLTPRLQKNPVELPAWSVTEALPVASSSTLLKQLGMPTAPFARCTQCHEGAKALVVGRKIPFSEPTQLRARLLEKSATGGGNTLYEEIKIRVRAQDSSQMPPHAERLSEVEIEQLERYLSQVVHGGKRIATQTK